MKKLNKGYYVWVWDPKKEKYFEFDICIEKEQIHCVVFKPLSESPPFLFTSLGSVEGIMETRNLIERFNKIVPEGFMHKLKLLNCALRV